MKNNKPNNFFIKELYEENIQNTQKQINNNVPEKIID